MTEATEAKEDGWRRVPNDLIQRMDYPGIMYPRQFSYSEIKAIAEALMIAGEHHTKVANQMITEVNAIRLSIQSKKCKDLSYEFTSLADWWFEKEMKKGSET